MAAVKKRQTSYPQAVFEIPLIDAIEDLILPPDREPTDKWHFTVLDDTLRITRVREPIEDVVDPPAFNAEPQALARKATRIR